VTTVAHEVESAPARPQSGADKFSEVASALSGSAAAGLAVAAILPALPVFVPIVAATAGYLGFWALLRKRHAR
jgi:hypothetical protein